MRPLPALVIIALIYIGCLCSGHPNEAAINDSYMSSSSSTSVADGYQVNISQTDDNGKCIETIIMSGNGIYKEDKHPCNDDVKQVINMHNSFVVGDEYFSDCPSVLVRIIGDKCTKEIFTEKNGKYTSTVRPMDDKECEKVKVKIEVLKEEQEKLKEWYANQQREFDQKMEQLKQNMQSLQDLFSGNFPFSN